MKLLGLVNNGVQGLHDILTDAFGTDYVMSSVPFTASANVPTYQFSASIGIDDFYKVRGVDVQVNGTQFQELKPYMFNERNMYARNQAYGYSSNYYGPYYRYRVQGDEIKIIPTPQAGTVFMLHYTPTATLLVSGSDTVDGINGWEDYIVVDAAIECLQPEGGDTTVLERRKMQLKQRIEEMAGLEAV